MATEPREKTWQEIWLPRLRHWGSKTLATVARPVVRIVLAVAAFLLLGWLIQTRVWTPLQDNVLPGPASDRLPQLEVESLQGIDNSRVERSEHIPRVYTGYSKLFSEAATPSPTP